MRVSETNDKTVGQESGSAWQITNDHFGGSAVFASATKRLAPPPFSLTQSMGEFENMAFSLTLNCNFRGPGAQSPAGCDPPARLLKC